MFRDAYAAELEYLYQLCEQVGREHPKVAPMLGRDADPSLSRLVQNVAFAAARLRQRLEDDAPEWIHPLVVSLRPELLRPFPSATILELTPEGTMKEPARVVAGALFGSRPVDGVSCAFRSCIDVDIRPWRLSAVSVAAERTELRLKLEIQDGAKIDALRGPLRLFLGSPTALTLRSLLLHGTTALVARTSSGRETLFDGAEHVRAVPPPPLPESEAGEPLLDLRSYFAWPDAYAFVDVGDLGRIELGPDRGLEIVLRLREPLPKNLTPDPSTVRLHCVPAVNAHRVPTVNVPLVEGRCRIELPTPEAQVYALERVALVRYDLTTRPAAPFAQFFPPALQPDGRMPLLYRVERAPSVLGAELAVSLAFVTFDPRATLQDVVSVDVDLLASDGDRAPRLNIGDVCVPTPASPPLLKFRNITPVSRSAPPVLAGDRLWRWFHLLRATFAEMADAAYLAEVLALANVAASASWPEAKADADVFRGILAVSTERGTRADHNQAAPGAFVRIDLDVTAFSGPGDVDLFGERVLALLARVVRTHEWVALTLRDAHGQPLRDYAPVQGSRIEL